MRTIIICRTVIASVPMTVHYLLLSLVIITNMSIGCVRGRLQWLVVCFIRITANLVVLYVVRFSFVYAWLLYPAAVVGFTRITATMDPERIATMVGQASASTCNTSMCAIDSHTYNLKSVNCHHCVVRITICQADDDFSLWAR